MSFYSRRNISSALERRQDATPAGSGRDGKEARERRLAVPNPGFAVREQQMIEIERKVAGEREAQAVLDGSRVFAHELVRHESERVPVAHDGIADKQRAAVGAPVERRLLGAKRSDRQRFDPARKRLAVL